MNEYEAIKQAERQLAAMSPFQLKKMRKSVRKLILADVQRRAITGGPSLLGRAQ